MFKQFSLLLMSFFLVGCATASTPSTSFLSLDYQTPKNPAPLTPSVLTGVTSANSLFASHEEPLLALVKQPVGSGSDRPEVHSGDSWSIVLARVYVADANTGWLEDTSNVALLLRVHTRDHSDIDGRWVLAAVAESVKIPSFVNFDNLVVWSGLSPNAITLDVQLVKLNKADKQRMSNYSALTGLAPRMIPAYGPIASALVQAGETLNAARDDYTVLLAYKAGFHPDHGLKYSAYALLPQKTALQNGAVLWYDLPYNEVKLDNNKSLFSNWCAFRIIKGSYTTFASETSDSLAKIGKIADDWVNSVDPKAPVANLMDSVTKLVSSSASANIINNTKFSEPSSLKNALAAFKIYQASASVKITDEDVNKIFKIFSSHFPADLAPQSNNPDDWIAAIPKLINYHYDWNQELWIKY